MLEIRLCTEEVGGPILNTLEDEPTLKPDLGIKDYSLIQFYKKTKTSIVAELILKNLGVGMF